MNERIKQLAEQATNDVKDEFGHWINIEFDKEKFAELIVRECIDTAFHKGHPDLEFLLKHFGVEE
jgi:hypothetical protein